MLKPELKQRFARDVELLAFLGGSNGCSTDRTGGNPNEGSFSSPRNTTDHRTQPCTAPNFLGCIGAFAFALNAKAAGKQRVGVAIDDDVRQFEGEL